MGDSALHPSRYAVLESLITACLGNGKKGRVIRDGDYTDADALMGDACMDSLSPPLSCPGERRRGRGGERRASLPYPAQREQEERERERKRKFMYVTANY
jgi:hypothetical protein